MAGYANVVGRADVGDALIPDQVINEIIQEAPKSSVVLDRAKQVRLSAKKAKQPVLATLPEAYWVDGDTGLKQTSKSQWESLTITAEELAVIVPIPDALVDDANIPLWDEIKPLLAEAIGKKVDQAALFGVDSPLLGQPASSLVLWLLGTLWKRAPALTLVWTWRFLVSKSPSKVTASMVSLPAPACNGS